MALHKVETVEKRAKALLAKLAEKRESLNPVELRALRKKVRRAQRKHRRLVQEAARKAGTAKKAEAEEAAG